KRYASPCATTTPAKAAPGRKGKALELRLGVIADLGYAPSVTSSGARVGRDRCPSPREVVSSPDDAPSRHRVVHGTDPVGLSANLRRGVPRHAGDGPARGGAGVRLRVGERAPRDLRRLPPLAPHDARGVRGRD